MRIASYIVFAIAALVGAVGWWINVWKHRGRRARSAYAWAYWVAMVLFMCTALGGCAKGDAPPGSPWSIAHGIVILLLSLWLLAFVYQGIRNNRRGMFRAAEAVILLTIVSLIVGCSQDVPAGTNESDGHVWGIYLHACPPRDGYCEKIAPWPGRFGNRNLCMFVASEYKRNGEGDRWMTRPGWEAEFFCQWEGR